LSDRAAALAFEMEGELRDWPALHRENLHPFRLKVKKLRYVLQMGDDSNHRFVHAVGEVKDAIGEWPDWQELAAVAKEVIQHSGCKLRLQIERTVQQKFEQALAGANRLRESHLKAPYGSVKKHAARGVSPGIVSAYALAASGCSVAGLPDHAQRMHDQNISRSEQAGGENDGVRVTYAEIRGDAPGCVLLNAPTMRTCILGAG
jgi:hypothetical protein